MRNSNEIFLKVVSSDASISPNAFCAIDLTMVNFQVLKRKLL